MFRDWLLNIILTITLIVSVITGLIIGVILSFTSPVLGHCIIIPILYISWYFGMRSCETFVFVLMIPLLSAGSFRYVDGRLIIPGLAITGGVTGFFLFFMVVGVINNAYIRRRIKCNDERYKYKYGPDAVKMPQDKQENQMGSTDES